MLEPNRYRELLLCAFALYLATSMAQLHAKQTSWNVDIVRSVSTFASSIRWHIEEMGRIEHNESDLFAPGN